MSLTATACGHCGSPVPPGRADAFCCAGCRAVYRLIHESGLGRYYELKPGRLAPLLGYFDARPSLEWLDQDPGMRDGRLDMEVEGLQCGACVWAIGHLARRQGASAGVNSALGRLSLRFDPARFDARKYLQSLFDLGYRVRPQGSVEKDPSRALLLRLGVCAAIAMNTMSFSLPFYFGLVEDGTGLAEALGRLNLALSVVSVAYGGGYFFRRAWQSLRRGIAHFDIPVAIGVAAVFTGSTWAHFKGVHGALYFDTLNVFLTLMLLGRYLQERALLKTRQALLQDDAFASCLVTEISAAPRELPFSEVRGGMRLLLQPGTLCPVDARLESAGLAEFDLASVTGELRPLALGPGAVLRSGARLVSSSAVRVLALTDFDASLLASLIPAESQDADEGMPVIWRWSVRYYVAFVLVAALGGLGFWLWKDPSMAGRVFVSTLVVTCPCGVGIAVPLARTQAMRRLFAMGVTTRRATLLDALHQVRQVWLDKTGTLTFTHLELEDPGSLEALAPSARTALMGAAGASRHPVSRTLARELSARGVPYPEVGVALEIPGLGVRFEDEEGSWFLGRSMEDGSRATFSLNGAKLASFKLAERRLADAPEALAQLRGLGLQVGLLSGDAPHRVLSMARDLAIPDAQALGNCSPEGKLQRVLAQPSLMLGDGLNDGQALAAAAVCGTPSWERSPVANAADFHFSSASLSWLPGLFRVARRLRRVLWFNIGFAWSYNLVMVSLTLIGLVSPIVCAVVMPLSALLVIGLSGRLMRTP